MQEERANQETMGPKQDNNHNTKGTSTVNDKEEEPVVVDHGNKKVIEKDPIPWTIVKSSFKGRKLRFEDKGIQLWITQMGLMF